MTHFISPDNPLYILEAIPKPATKSIDGFSMQIYCFRAKILLVIAIIGTIATIDTLILIEIMTLSQRIGCPDKSKSHTINYKFDTINSSLFQSIGPVQLYDKTMFNYKKCEY